MKLNWDDDLSEPLASEWHHLVSSLKDIENIMINRYILNHEVGVILLFKF